MDGNNNFLDQYTYTFHFYCENQNVLQLGEKRILYRQEAYKISSNPCVDGLTNGLRLCLLLCIVR